VSSPQHPPVPPSAVSAGVSPTEYADALLSGREWCSGHGGYVPVAQMHDGDRVCRACHAATRKAAGNGHRARRRRDK
jgi:hypothetical protein